MLSFEPSDLFKLSQSKININLMHCLANSLATEDMADSRPTGSRNTFVVSSAESPKRSTGNTI